MLDGFASTRIETGETSIAEALERFFDPGRARTA